MVGKYENFEACVISQKAKGLSEEDAVNLCKAIQAATYDRDLSDQAVEVIETNISKEFLAALDNAYDENVIEECFILGDDTFVEESEMRVAWTKAISESRKMPSDTRAEIVSKAYEGSTQNTSEIEVGSLALGLGENLEEVSPPYDPRILREFLELDSLHYRAVRAKTADSVGRGIKFEATTQIVADDATELPKGNYIKQSAFDREKDKIAEFLGECNDISGFDGVIEKAAMDYESIGYCAIEVIRSLDNVARRINHVPVERIKVLKGWRGFVEEIDSQGNKIYYQNLGEKVVSPTRKDPITGRPAKYNPDLDGAIDKAKPNYIDRETGEPTTDYRRSANEIIYKANPHPKTIYYGLPDFIPAAGHMLANAEIRDYLLQFFEHNTVPRYAVIVKGAKVDPEVKEHIKNFFSQEVKGKAHKTLFIPIASIRGEVDIVFQPLDVGDKDGSFLEAKKNNDQVIMVAHGTPPAILGIAESANLGSGKGLSQAEIYKDRIVTPRQKGWANCLNSLFRFGLGVRNIRCKFDPLDVRDREAEMSILTGYQDHGTLSINEVREKAELGKPIKGGDRPYFSASSGIYFIDSLEDAVGGEFERRGSETTGSSTGPASGAPSASSSTGASTKKAPPKKKGPGTPIKKKRVTKPQD